MQYFITVQSRALSDSEAGILSSQKVAGVVLYGNNVGSYQSTARLISDIKSINPNLLVTVDEEGGIVSRFGHLMPNLSQPYLATQPDKKVQEYFKTRSEFLKNIGVDINWAPVVDLAPNDASIMYKRSFGSTVDKIVNLAQICIKEQRRAGISSCLKHFPGHGFTTTDSHQQVPIINRMKKNWLINEGRVFGNLITSAKPEYIMVGHIVYPEVDSLPASLSKQWVENILKGELGYRGLVISDDIAMNSLNQSLNEKVFKNAGLDAVISTRGLIV